MITQEHIIQQLQRLAPKLLSSQKHVATAESCTGGWLAKCMTDLTGSSAWYECSVVSYSNQAKHDFLGVRQETLDTYGAVSQPVVKEMVLGLLDRCNANIGVSISGIAGPGGGTPEKPVGTVWIALATPGQLVEAVRYQFEGDRDQVRLQAMHEALNGVERILQQEAG